MDELDFFETLEESISQLPLKEQAKVFSKCASKCVESFVLKTMRQQFEECGCSLDEQYKKYGNSEYYWAKIIEPGHIYELGYPRCLCPIVQKGFGKSVTHCECSRQSILYVLHDLLPNKNIDVILLGTVLSGADKCSFRVIIE